MKTKLSGEIKIDAYAVFSDALENAVSYGIRRYYKHRDIPDYLEMDLMASEVADTVMNELSAILKFD